LEKNYNQAIDLRGLQVLRKISAVDMRGFSFYEICLSQVGDKFKPDPQGDLVGYVNTNNVIDYELPPSNERFVPNASIRILSSHNITSVQVHEYVKGEFVPIAHELLENRQAVRVLDSFGLYTLVEYNDVVLGGAREGGWVSRGWIKSEYVSMNGLSALQLIAIAALALLVLGGVAWVVVRMRRRVVS